MTPAYTPEYFLKKFEAIPEEELGKALQALSDEAFQKLYGIFFRADLIIRIIYLTPVPRYQQPTPKLRILAALTDIINKQKQS